ncbi:two-component system, cell cycle response regulator [Paracoccus isoporae]|uniref:diguanylate cyclase n=1 Tax=Paracoccus isoporae TaxID=591205 RepID=A0A1G7BEF9_9RHOB|nr:diguanylate cyclase [Paracoccus isoporae]SDE25337.1 two-component system, cell cycle response regulator [Paracoccus isoporae]
MLGRLLVIDHDLTSRLTMKLRLEAANYRVITAGHAAEAMGNCGDVAAVILRADDLAGLAALADDITRLRGALPAPVIVQCAAADRSQAFRAGAEYVLDRTCPDPVLRARLRCWTAQPSPAPAGFADDAAEFEPSDRIGLVTDDAALAKRWQCAARDASGRKLMRLLPRDVLRSPPRGYAAILVDGGADGAGLDHLADLRVRLLAAGQGTALALIQRGGHAAEEARALEIGATDVLAEPLCGPAHHAELAARLALLLRHGREGERRCRDTRLAHRLAGVDSLTGLANRRSISREISEAAAGGGDFGLLMIDIDRFKQINDRHGHAAGDAVLRDVSVAMRDHLGQAGWLARYGGEEFLALLPGADETDAVSLAEGLRRAICAAPVRAQGLAGEVPVPVTISIGVATSDGSVEPRCRVEDTMRRADAALIAAKRAGRNIVMLSRDAHAA